MNIVHLINIAMFIKWTMKVTNDKLEKDDLEKIYALITSTHKKSVENDSLHKNHLHWRDF